MKRTGESFPRNIRGNVLDFPEGSITHYLEIGDATMPRPFVDYSWKEWRRIRPLVDRYKHARYQMYSAYMIHRTAPPLSMVAIRDQIRGKNVIASIAFNDFERIEQQARLVRQFVKDAAYLICDNSSNSAIAGYVAEMANRQNILYVRLPRSPWCDRDFSRDHGFAMTWVWRHVIRPGQPRSFGFVDQDMYPLRPTDPFAPLASYPIAGRVMAYEPSAHCERIGHWYLWAGFCFFRFGAVRRIGLNFGLDPLAGFDTGFLNWHRLYRYLDRSRVPEPPFIVQPILPNIPAEECAIELIGDWLHESRFRNLELHEAKRQWVQELLAPLLVSEADNAVDQLKIRSLAAREAQKVVDQVSHANQRALRKQIGSPKIS
jgi:hypothetical protein